MFQLHDEVQIVNHSEPSCNGQYGTVRKIDIAYDGRTRYYSVYLHEKHQNCMCTEDELMEG